MISLSDIEAARERIRGAVRLTPCILSESLSKQLGCEVYLKLENLQRTGSFKERGALNRLLALTPEERRRGVITASAGNHAQALSYHAGRLGIPVTVVMPEPAAITKVNANRALGARIVFHGDLYDEASVEAHRLQAAENLVYIHPFDDDLTLAGAGTIGLELCEQIPGLQAALVSVGGGSLAAGVAVALKAKLPQGSLHRGRDPRLQHPREESAGRRPHHSAGGQVHRRRHLGPHHRRADIPDPARFARRGRHGRRRGDRASDPDPPGAGPDRGGRGRGGRAGGADARRADAAGLEGGPGDLRRKHRHEPAGAHHRTRTAQGRTPLEAAPEPARSLRAALQA